MHPTKKIAKNRQTMRNENVLKWSLLLSLFSFISMLNAKPSSIYVELGVPYHQISGDVRVESYSYAPFSSPWEGITKVYFRGKFLYSIKKYFPYYTAVSKDGQNFYEIYFQFKDSVSIYHYRNGLKINEIKPSTIKRFLQKSGKMNYPFWSSFHLDRKNYERKGSMLSKLEFRDKFKNDKIIKISQVNDMIFIKEDILYIKSLDNTFITLNLSTGEIDAKTSDNWLSNAVSGKKNCYYRKILKYDILGNGKFPIPKNNSGTFASLVKKILLSNEIFKLSSYKGQLQLYFNIKLKNNGFIEEIDFLSLHGDGFETSYEQNLFLAETLRKTKFSTKNIPKGSEYLTFTSWGGVSAHPIRINF